MQNNSDKLYPNKCPMLDICFDNLDVHDFHECNQGKNQCGKAQKVIIGFLDDILSTLQERIPEPVKPHFPVEPGEDDGD